MKNTKHLTDKSMVFLKVSLSETKDEGNFESRIQRGVNLRKEDCLLILTVRSIYRISIRLHIKKIQMFKYIIGNIER